jgi:hypothetical protein
LRRNDSTSSDVRSRYWTMLFDNLKRSIEQIYQACESDQNPLQCQVNNRFRFLFRIHRENVLFRLFLSFARLFRM